MMKQRVSLVACLLVVVCIDGCNKAGGDEKKADDKSQAADGPPPDPPTVAAIPATPIRAAVQGEPFKSPHVLVREGAERAFEVVVIDGKPEANDPCSFKKTKQVSLATNQQYEIGKPYELTGSRTTVGGDICDGEWFSFPDKVVAAFQLDSHANAEGDKPGRIKIRIAARLTAKNGDKTVEGWMSGTYEGTMCKDLKRLD